MRKPPRTEKRAGQWYYRRRVPTKLVSTLGFSEYRESLNTPGIDEARKRAAKRDLEVTVELQVAEATLKNQQATDRATQATQKLSPEALRHIRGAVAAHMLAADDQYRQTRPDEDQFSTYESVLSDHYGDISAALADGSSFTKGPERQRVEDALRVAGISVAPDSPQWRDAAVKAVEGYRTALQGINSRSRGEWVETPEIPESPAHGPAGGTVLRLGVVIDDYLSTIKQSGYTRKVQRCLQLFGEVIGRDTPVCEIRQKAVTNFLREICKLPTNWAHQYDNGIPVATLLAGTHGKLMAPATYRDNYRAPLDAFLRASKRDHGDDGFPASLTTEGIEYVGVRKDNDAQQRALTEPELKVLIEGPKFAAMAKDSEQASMYWFTLLSLFTGARPRELCQVNPQVDHGELESIEYIDLSHLTPAGVGIKKSIKTGEERRIPIHPELVRLGFPDYIRRLKEEGADRLFPSFRVKKGNPFEAAGDLFSSLLKDVGLYDDKAPPGQLVVGAYVMRKTFITMCRNQGVISKEITGHSDGTTTREQDRSYIFGPEPLHGKNEQLKKLKVGLKIPIRPE